MAASVGSFEARQTNLMSADVRYQVVLFPDALVAVRTGGQFTGTAPSFLGHFGLIGMGIAALLGAAGQEEATSRARELEALPREELLARHEQNFEVPLSTVTRAGLEAQGVSLHGKAVGRLFLELGEAKPVSLLLQDRLSALACRDFFVAAMGDRLYLDPIAAAWPPATPSKA